MYYNVKNDTDAMGEVAHPRNRQFILAVCTWFLCRRSFGILHTVEALIVWTGRLRRVDQGSIGTQTLDICREKPERFDVVSLAAGSNLALLAEQIAFFK